MSGPTITRPVFRGSRLAAAVFAVLVAICVPAGPVARAQTGDFDNIATRGFVGVGAQVLIPGFVISGGNQYVLIRGLGPALALRGVEGSIAKTRLELYNAGGVLLASNEGWGAAPNAALIRESAPLVGAPALPEGSADSAIFLVLPPGVYTAILSGPEGATGVGLAEVFAVRGFAGLLNGIVRNALTAAPVPGAAIQFAAGGQPLETAASNATGGFSLVARPGLITATVTAAGFLPAVLTAEVLADLTTQAEAVRLVPTATGDGNVAGVITNALTGAVQPGVQVRVRSGIGARTGPFVGGAATTDAAGAFALVLPVGVYTAELTLPGFSPTYFTIASPGGGTFLGDQNSTISPEVAAGSVRIVLTWGAEPSDLDSHLTGPAPEGGTSRFHVYWINEGALETSPFAGLDVDDVSSFGPETITITQTRPGVFRYSVHDYTNLSRTDSRELSESGAVVSVIRGSTEVARFPVPGNRVGTLWTVFELDGATGAIRPVNTFSNQADPQAVAGTKPRDPRMSRVAKVPAVAVP